MSREFSLLILSTPDSTVIATGIISNIIYIPELQNEPNVALHSLKGFLGYFLGYLFVIFSENTRCKFHNKPHASKGANL